MDKTTDMFLENLKKLMAQRGATQSQLAELLGRDNSVITNLFKGERRLALDEAQKIADYFGVSLSYLTSGREEDPFVINTGLYRRAVAIAENYLEQQPGTRPSFEEFSFMVLRCYHLALEEQTKHGSVNDVRLAMRFMKEWEKERQA